MLEVEAMMHDNRFAKFDFSCFDETQDSEISLPPVRRVAVELHTQAWKGFCLQLLVA
jgi:hypothetical protein